MNKGTARACAQSVGKAPVFPPDCSNRTADRTDPPCADNTVEKQLLVPVGTGHAINLSPSVASSPTRRWGGSRNNASRTSESLSLDQVANIIEAAQFAAAAGMPFNRHVTIHWEQAGIPDERAAWATGRFLKLVGDWVGKRRNLNFNQEKSNGIAWAWARESGHRKGSHVHILLHLPAGAQIGAMQRRWLRSITRRPYRPRTIKTTRIGGTAGAAHSAPATYQANLSKVLSYVLKGACPTAAAELELEQLQAGGLIIGKRAATSQNIGQASRRRAAARALECAGKAAPAVS